MKMHSQLQPRNLRGHDISAGSAAQRRLNSVGGVVTGSGSTDSTAASLRERRKANSTVRSVSAIFA